MPAAIGYLHAAENKAFANRQLQVEALSRLFGCYSELLLFKPGRQLDAIEADIARTATDRLAKQEAFGRLKSSLMELARDESNQRPLKAMRMAPSFGRLMKCCDISPEEIRKAGHPKIADNLDALKQHLMSQGKWEQLDCR